MTERPILFSAPMVRALLAGTKTQTRRVVKYCGDIDSLEASPNYPEEWVPWVDGDPQESIFCPYGVPGDTLWVREAFSGSWGLRKSPPRSWPSIAPLWYWADGDPTEGDWTKPKPSIHMPRWASRITLRITDVRVERLNDISEADAKAEGLEWVSPTYGVGSIAESWQATPVASYQALWEHINGAGSWAANAWVWAVSFEVVR